MMAWPVGCLGRCRLAVALSVLGAMWSWPALAAKTPRSTQAAVATLPKVRLVSISQPVALATVQGARRPVKVGSVTYVLGDYRTNYDVYASGGVNGAISWSVVQQGRRQPQWSGLVPASRLRGMQGSVCVVVQSGPRAAPIAPGEKRFSLFYQFSPEHQAMLLVSPAPLPAEPVRTAFTIAGWTDSEESAKRSAQRPGHFPPSSGTGHGGGVKWLRGAKGYQEAMRQHAAKKKGVLLYFYSPQSIQCKRLEKEIFTACRAQEILVNVLSARIDPGQGPEEKALAARLGVTKVPAVLVFPPGSTAPKWVVPAPESQKMGGGGGESKPCHVTDVIAAALKGK